MLEEAKEAQKRLDEYKEKALKLQESMKAILTKTIPEGEKIESPDYKISWKKASSVYIGDNLDPEEVYKVASDLVNKKVTFTFDKKKIKAKLDNGQPVYEGMSIVEKNNIQIK